MCAFRALPEAIINELPASISNKILLGEALEESDRKVARIYLDGTITHPEIIARNSKQLIAAVEFYIHVGAKLSNYAFRAVSRVNPCPSIVREIPDYPHLIDVPVIMVKRSAGSCDVFQRFGIINSDKGYKSWSFYAENFNKLARGLEIWAKESGAHLYSGYAYDIHLDKTHIGRISYGEFVALPDASTFNYISEVFGSPVSLRVDISIEISKLGDLSAINLSGRVQEFTNIKSRSRVVLPESKHLAVDYIQSKINCYVKGYVSSVVRLSKVSRDISVVVYVNGVKVGVKDICAVNISFFLGASDVILPAIGRGKGKVGKGLFFLIGKIFSNT